MNLFNIVMELHSFSSSKEVLQQGHSQGLGAIKHSTYTVLINFVYSVFLYILHWKCAPPAANRLLAEKYNKLLKSKEMHVIMFPYMLGFSGH